MLFFTRSLPLVASLLAVSSLAAPTGILRSAGTRGLNARSMPDLQQRHGADFVELTPRRARQDPNQLLPGPDDAEEESDDERTVSDEERLIQSIDVQLARLRAIRESTVATNDQTGDSERTLGPGNQGVARPSQSTSSSSSSRGRDISLSTPTGSQPNVAGQQQQQQQRIKTEVSNPNTRSPNQGLSAASSSSLGSSSRIDHTAAPADVSPGGKPSKRKRWAKEVKNACAIS